MARRQRVPTLGPHINSSLDAGPITNSIIIADLPAKATPILDMARRRAILASIYQKLGGARDLDAWVEGSPVVAMEFLVE
jgi:hypothetical protein